MKARWDFSINGYVSVRKDRLEGIGGGCATFVREGVPYRVVDIEMEVEGVIIEIWAGGRNIVIVNFYNPCKKLELRVLERLAGVGGGLVMLCGDFNAHNILWGSGRTDYNGRVVEDLLVDNQLVVLNDGGGTRVDINTGRESVLDLSIVSSSLAPRCEWEVYRDSTLGSDHYPVIIRMNLGVGRVEVSNSGKWNFEKANWELFSRECDSRLRQMDDSLSVDRINSILVEGVMGAAEKAIYRSKGGRKGKIVPWWDDKCREAIKDRNRAFRRVKRDHNQESLLVYKRAQAVVRRTIRGAKRSHWREFCGTIGAETKVGDVWGMIRKMGGVRREWGYPVLSEGGEVAINDKEKAGLMARAFAGVHSSDSLTEEGRRGREETRLGNIEALKRQKSSGGDLDVPFTMGELKRALGKTKMSAPGRDGVCYIMIRNMGEEGLGRLLMLFNKVWREGRLPSSWKEAVIIPVRKPGRDGSKPLSYRPIALTSCVCKLMERMVNERLLYYVEVNGLIARYQSGFRKGRGCMDMAVCLENEIRKAQANREVVAAVFFDVEKAYDMMWREGLLIKLNRMGVGGRLFNWCCDFLEDRVIMVRVGVEMSDTFRVENGTPQGSVISPTLFLLMINDIFEGIEGGMGRSLFADDGALWKRGRNVEYVARKLQEGIDRVVSWGLRWSFRFSVDKSKVMFFGRKKIREGIRLMMYGRNLERVDSFRFLGVIFDRGLTWRNHIDSVAEKCKKVLNVMRCIAGQDWGASRCALVCIYVVLIRSRIDYGSVVYGSAARTRLEKLDVVQGMAFRICVGGVKSAPNCALQVEVGQMPLGLRRKQLVGNYWLNIRGQDMGHPVKDIMGDQWERGRGQSRESFAWVGDRVALELGVKGIEFEEVVRWPVRPRWLVREARVDLELLERKRRDKGRDLAQEFYSYVGEKYRGYRRVFTDGSKDVEKGVTGAAMVVSEEGVVVSRRLSDMLSIYGVELVGILLAMRWVEGSEERDNLICCDSAGALMSIRNGVGKYHQEVLEEILDVNDRVFRQGRVVSFLWVPAHVGIVGNEKADRAAKEASRREQVEFSVRLSRAEGKSIVWKEIGRKWQDEWDRERKGRHLYRVQKKVGGVHNMGGSRREQVVMSRIRIGHSCLNEGLRVMGKHASGLCGCGGVESVEHVVCECVRYENERRRMFGKLRRFGVEGSGLKEVVGSLEIREGRRAVMSFLRETGVFRRI